MKKKDFDLFNILLGVIIGCILGFFVFTQIKPNKANAEEPVVKEDVYGTVYIIQLGCESDVNSLNQLINKLEILNIYYELYEEGGKNYLFHCVYSNLSFAQNKKSELENLGLVVSIRSDFILDLPKTVISNLEQYEFYTEVINNLINSLDKTDIVISEKYYSNPIDIELFSNISILMNIKNEQIKSNYQLNTLCLLFEKLK